MGSVCVCVWSERQSSRYFLGATQGENTQGSAVYPDWEKACRAVDPDSSEYVVRRKRRVREMNTGPRDYKRCKKFTNLGEIKAQ